MSKTYTTKEVAELLGVQDQTIRKAIYNGQLTAEKVGRDYFITQDNLNAWNSTRKPRKRKKPAEGSGNNGN